MRYLDLLIVVRERWKIITVTLLAFVVAGVMATALLPRHYTAFAAIIIEPKSTDPVIGLSPQALPAFVATQIDVLQSERVANLVVDNLHTQNSVCSVEASGESVAFLGKERTGASQVLLKNQRVRPSRDSGVLGISFRAGSPVVAQCVANAIADAFLKVSLDLKLVSARKNLAIFEEAVASAREKLIEARGRLSRFQIEKNIIPVTDSIDVESARLAELTSQLVVLQGRLSEDKSRAAISGLDGAQSMREVLDNQGIQTLKSDIARLEAGLGEAEQRLGPEHPQVKGLDAELRLAKNRLALEVKRITTSVSVSAQTVVQREAMLKTAIEDQRTRILQLRTQRDGAALLLSDVDGAQKQLEAANQRLQQAYLESQYRQTNVSVLSTAELPTVVSAPQASLILTTVIFIGLCVGCGLAIGLELFDPKVRSVESLVSVLDLPVLAYLENANNAKSSVVLSYEPDQYLKA